MNDSTLPPTSDREDNQNRPGSSSELKLASVRLALEVNYSRAERRLHSCKLMYEQSLVMWGTVRQSTIGYRFDNHGKMSKLKIVAMMISHRLPETRNCDDLRYVIEGLTGQRKDRQNKNLVALFGTKLPPLLFHCETGEPIGFKPNILQPEDVVIAVRQEFGDDACREAHDSLLRKLLEGIDPKTGAFNAQAYDGPLFADEAEDASSSVAATLNGPLDGTADVAMSFGSTCDMNEQSGIANAVLAAELDWTERTHRLLKLPFSADGVAVPLERVYTALTVDPTSASERQAVYELLRRFDLLQFGSSQDLAPGDAFRLGKGESISHTYARSHTQIPLEFLQLLQLIGQRDANAMNVGQAYRDHRCLVILGDPGSGKTTMARWLALALSRAWTRGGEFRVDRRAIDPDFDPATDEEAETVSLGPVRFPILVRAADYAAALAESQNEELTFFQFLGRHRWTDGSTPTFRGGEKQFGESVTAELRHDCIRSLIARHEAAIIVDGFDEVADARVRETIRDSLLAFLKEHVFSHHSVEGDLFGNRLVLTSRIAGYNLCWLEGPVMHVLVRGMSATAQRSFIDNWMVAIHEQRGTREAEARSLAENLREQLADPKRRLQDFASNPLQAGALCAIYTERLASLPDTRGEVYDLAIRHFFDIWKMRLGQGTPPVKFSEKELMELVEDVAYRIHTEEVGGLISEEQLRKTLHASLTRLHEGRARRRHPPTDLLVEAVIHVLSNDVGLLAPRGQTAYGFLVLSIQEYLVARRLSRGSDDEAVAACLLHLDDARFREPILMSIGHLGLRAAHRLEQFLTVFLRADDVLQDILPRTALTVVAALDELPTVPTTVLERVAERLIESYIPDTGHHYSDRVRQLIRHGLQRMREIEESAVVRALSCSLQPTSVLRNPAAVASLLIDLEEDESDRVSKSKAPQEPFHSWCSSDVVKAILAAEPYDSAELGFPIHTLLRTHAKAAASSLRPLPMREFLTSNSAAWTHAARDIAWSQLLLALYGGVADQQRVAVLRRYREFAAYLAQNDDSREQFAPQFAERFGLDDVVYNIAVFLDTRGGRWKHDRRPSREIALEEVERDSPLTAGFQRMLRAHENPELHVADLVDIRDSADADPSLRVDAMIALVALGHSTTLSMIRDTPHVPTVVIVRQRLRDRLAALADSAFEACEVLQKTLPLRLEAIPGPRANPAIRSLFTVLAAMTDGTTPAYDQGTFFDALPSWHGGEHLLALLTGNSIEVHAPVIKEVVWTQETWKQRCAGHRGVQAIVYAIETLRGRPRLRMVDWRISGPPPKTWRSDDVPICVLDAIASIASPISVARGGLLQAILHPLREENPELLPEALAFAVGDAGETTEAYWQALDPRLAELDRCEVRHRLLAFIEALTSSYYRARSLLRLAQAWPDRQTELVDRAAVEARRIQDPHDRAQVIEWLCREFSPSDRSALMSDVIDCTSRIANPDDKARSFARLVFLVPAELRVQLLLKAVAAVREIPSVDDRAETLRLIASLCAVYPESRHEWSTATLTLENDWAKSVAAGQCGPLLRDLAALLPVDSREDASVWAILSLGATLIDLELAKDPSPKHLWQRLAETPSADHVVELAKVGGHEGLELTGAVAVLLDRLIEEHGDALVAPLLPMLERPDRETLPLLKTWTQRREHRASNPFLQKPGAGPSQLASFAHLWITELCGLKSESVVAVVDSTVSSHDRVRGRASAALELSGSDNKIRVARPVSLRGTDTLVALGTMLCTTPDQRKKIRIGWFMESLVYDDVDTLRRLIQSCSSSPNDAASRYLISKIESLSDQSGSILLEGLASSPPHVQTALFQSVLRLASQGQRAPGSLPQLLNVLSDFACTSLSDTRVHVYCVADLVQAITRTSVANQHVATDEWLKCVQVAYAKCTKRLGALISDATAEEVWSLLRRLGGRMYRSSKSSEYLSNAVAVVEDRMTMDSLAVVTHWLEQLRFESASEDSRPYDVTANDLLLLLAGLALSAPNQFLQHAEIRSLRPLMLHFAKHCPDRDGRCASIVILGSLRVADRDILEVFRHGLLDTSDVAQGVYRAIGLLRQVPKDAVHDLIGSSDSRSGLYQDSEVSAYATGKVLESIGASPWIQPAERSAIINGLADAIRHPSARRLIHFGYVESTMPPPKRLEQEFYNSLIRVARLDVTAEVTTA